ncbi:hypothetical protein T440DRAFT_489524 [Plenodomus tracheiphilus IPT5]|uniref:Autophagy-related protein 1 n=1 Tax=Plenodomus tracheiphilus IPT5 TaxID=1408161 RepID=A0A6A7B5A2_9PLEO|nr:hypothetical protein T440DRAFT_489524 [Plenodomus tracheiphilus IPT5]
MDANPSQQTQPLTQQVLDPRRLGRNNSGLNDGDIADVLLILHPATPTAIRIVEQAAQQRPEHVLFRNSLESMSSTLTDIEEQETIIVDAHGDRVGHNSRAGADLALRMSSARQLKFKELGFIFGRNPASADIIFGNDSGKRISNQHFRIYLNTNGIIMLEDMSTNGTIVDDVLLKCKDPRFSKIRMLGSGSIICIQNSNDAEMIKFIVRVPSRVTSMPQFQENLRRFITECTPHMGEDQDKAVQRITQHYGGPAMKWDGGDKYNIVGQIGKGAFATVYQLATKMDGKLLAAKELEKRRFIKNGLLDKKIDNEMKIMQDLRHPNIVEFVEYHDQGDYLYIIMEFVRQGDLQGYLNQVGLMKEEVARTMAQQILSALNYLHRSQITHRDIKPDNILIADLNPFTVKLSDFGLSKVVKHDETFLKTFCGTLLYCAPEVFPDYGTGPVKGTKRRRGAKVYHSYSSSVDIWSFGGVLWNALCGEPPFKGIADATGEAMYNNIMASHLDPTPLQRAGVSAQCIDLLMRMLRTDPSKRPTDRECLHHAWLKDGADVLIDPILQSIVEEDESEDPEEQLSQLSIREEVPESDDEEEADILSDDELMGLLDDRVSKRPRADPLYPRNQVRDNDDSSAAPSFQSSHLVGEGESFHIMPKTRQPRLFGEIGQSALESSFILHAHANDALSDDKSIHIIQGVGGAENGHTVGGAEQQQAHSQVGHDLSSPSLLGTESLVRDMNMTSPHSPVSRTQSPALPDTPKTPEFLQRSSLHQSSGNFSQISEPTPKARQSGFNRQISLPMTASYFYDPMDPSTHNIEYASRVSGIDFVSQGSQADAGARSESNTTQGSQASEHSTNSSAAAVQSPSTAIPSVPAQLNTGPPTRRLGKLVATPESFAPTLVLNIDQSKTTWGRQLNNTVVYEDSNDTRIPKTAFIIFWYSSGGESRSTVDELSQKGKDWTSLENLHVGIWTCATFGITVNGKLLKQHNDKGYALYGHLHTGDVVQVYQDPRGPACQKFRCEFYLGSGREPRPAGSSFNTLVGTKRAHFWALPAFLRIALASQHAFSVFDDLLAFPQYEIAWPDTFVSEKDATSLLSHASSPSPSSATTPGTQETQELSKRAPSPADSTPSEDVLDQTYEAVVLQGQRYLCSIPVIPDQEPQNSTTSAEDAKAEEEKELVRAADRGWQLLEGMRGNCIYYLSGWWSYSFCYTDEVKQFHQLPPSRGVPIYPPVEDTSVHSYVLGRYPKREKSDNVGAPKTLGSEQGSKEAFDDEGNQHEDKGLEVPRLETKGGSRYMVQRLSGGTECDLTGKPRKIDVQFHCNPQSADRIAMIKETSTCSYLMIIDTPRLCRDAAFQPPQENLAHPVTCHPVIPDSQFDSWTAARIEPEPVQAEHPVPEPDTANLNPLREVTEGLEGTTKRGPIIGGIEVGAQSLVGSQGKVIEKSVVVGGGKETYIGTVASSTGKQMSKEEMKKLNIADPKDVEKLKGNLKKLAGSKGWKLDLVDTPRGREFRGIIEADEQDEEEGKRGKEKEGKDEAKNGGMGRGRGKDGDERQGELEDEEELEEGSEEVYKDEL